MGIQKNAGFTIVEVMLVLAITGLMLVGILAGASAQINRQEYRSSVTELEAHLQQQYNTVLNPQNDRGPTSLTATTCGLPAGVSRGAAPNCFIVGRLVTANAAMLTEYPVLGAAPATGSVTAITPTSGWKLYLDASQKTTYTLSWGSSIQAQLGTTGAKTSTFNALILMSPQTGALTTYASNGTPVAASGAPLEALLTKPANDLNLCVQSGLSSFTGGVLAVQIGSSATSASAVQIPPQADGVCS